MCMSSERKAVLIAMRDEILERLKNAQADMEAVERLIAVHEELAPPATAASVEEIRQAAIGILEENGGPLHRQVLLERMTNQGIHVSGKVPINNLGAILSRFGKDFESHGQGGWGLKRPAASSPRDYMPLIVPAPKEPPPLPPSKPDWDSPAVRPDVDEDDLPF